MKSILILLNSDELTKLLPNKWAQRESEARGGQEISSDARYISYHAAKNTQRLVTHLWVLFVLLPVLAGVLFSVLAK